MCSPGNATIVWIILGGVAIGGLWVGLYLLHQSRWYQHRRLFRQLCRIHHLDRASIGMLRRLGQELRLPYPSWVFVDPRCLTAAQQVPGIPFSQLRQLQTHLFGELQSQPEAPTPPENPA